MFWLIRQLLKLAVLVVLVGAGFMAWALLWPKPHLRPMPCPPHRLHCTTVSGRLLYHTTFGAGRRAHIVLISSSSLTLPGIATGEVPKQLTHPPKGLGFGDWVSVDGLREVGSHHEHDLHILGIATSRARIRCGVINGAHVCRPAEAWPAALR